MSLPFLETIGLTAKESQIYELLLKKGELTAGQITGETSLKRATVYKCLSTLQAKALVSQQQKDKKIHFKPEPPTQLLELAEVQYKKLERAKKDLQTILPELNSEYISAVERPIVRAFEGEKGIKAVFEDIYAPKNEPVLGCVDLETADKALPNYITTKLIPLRLKNKLFARSFIGNSPQAQKVHQNDARSNRESFLLKKEEYPLPAEIDVYEDKVAMLSFHNCQFVGLLIQNQDIATSLKSIFRLAFDQSKAEK